MVDYKGLDDLALRILANLNEAGAENVSSLLNTVLRSTGRESDRMKYLNVLRVLYNRGLIEFANDPSATNMEWIALPQDETLQRLDLLEGHLRWDKKSGCWRWVGDQPRLEVLATQRGLQLSHEILEQFGWKITGAAEEIDGGTTQEFF